MSTLGGYKIGAIAKLTGVSPATLRLWEEQHGLLQPARTLGGTRLYSDLDLVRVLYIRELLSARGYSLDGIARIMEEGRRDYPDLLIRLVQLESSRPASDPLAVLASETRRFLEDAHLRDVTNRDLIREARLRRLVHQVASRVAESDTLQAAVEALVTGIREATGAHTSGFALYDAATDALTVQVVHRGDHAVRLNGSALPVDGFFSGEWLASLRRRKPFYGADVSRQPPSSELVRRMTALGLKSAFSQPLTVGSCLVGTVGIASRNPDGIPADAQFVVERLGTLTGPAIAYFAIRERG